MSVYDLTAAAYASVRITPDPQSGYRPGDPLREIVPDDLMSTDAQRFAAITVATDQIVGYEVDTDNRTGSPVARIRSALRRWAVMGA